MFIHKPIAGCDAVGKQKAGILEPNILLCKAGQQDLTTGEE